VGDLAAACAEAELDDVLPLGIMITLLPPVWEAHQPSARKSAASPPEICATRDRNTAAVRENPDTVGLSSGQTLRYEPQFRGHYGHVRVDVDPPSRTALRRRIE